MVTPTSATKLKPQHTYRLIMFQAHLIRQQKFLKIAASDHSTVVCGPSPRNPHEYPHESYTAWKQSLGYIFGADSRLWVYLFFNFHSELRKTHHLCRVRYGRSRSSKVVDLGSNQQERRTEKKIVGGWRGLSTKPASGYCWWGESTQKL